MNKKNLLIRIRGVVRWPLLVIFLLIPMMAPRSCCRPEHIEALRNVGMILEMAYRSGGNAVLVLDSDTKSGVVFPVELGSTSYPPNASTDKAWYTSARIKEKFGQQQNVNLTSFQLFCGTDSEDPENFETTLVFYSDNFWSGTKTIFRCTSQTENLELSGSISNVLSFCMYNSNTSYDRRNRCRNGPNCTDGMRNGNETDRDCGGGSCPKCGEGRSCNENLDCVSSLCIDNECHVPNCHDNMLNQNESDIDCGGVCSDCNIGERCNRNSDCTTNYCSSGICKLPPTCSGAEQQSSAGNYSLVVEASYGCTYLVTYFANNLSDAETCANRDGFSRISSACDYIMRAEQDPNDPDYNYFVNITAETYPDALNCFKSTICWSCNPELIDTQNCHSIP